MSKNTIRLDSAQSAVRATVARALAKALITGFEVCQEEGRPLTQLQEIDMATMSIMSYDEAIETSEGLELESTWLKT